MATARAVADVAPAVLFQSPAVAVGRLTSIMTDNQGVSPVTVTLQDTFLPDPSAKVPSPVQEVVDRLQFTVGAGQVLSISRDELQDIGFFGTCQTVSNISEPLCVIQIGYHFQ